MKPLKLNISLTLDEHVVLAIKNLAEQNERSVSSYINLVLKDHIEKISKK